MPDSSSGRIAQPSTAAEPPMTMTVRATSTGAKPSSTRPPSTTTSAISA